MISMDGLKHLDTTLLAHTHTHTLRFSTRFHNDVLQSSCYKYCRHTSFSCIDFLMTRITCTSNVMGKRTALKGSTVMTNALTPLVDVMLNLYKLVENEG